MYNTFAGQNYEKYLFFTIKRGVKQLFLGKKQNFSHFLLVI